MHAKPERHPQAEVNSAFFIFRFGGFCFNAELCKYGALNQVPKVQIDEAQLARCQGVFELDSPDNLFKDWYVVHVFECTADFSWGDNVVDYPVMRASPAITIRHKGFIHASAVRDWIFDNFAAPEQIVVSGTSGGGDGALAHGAYIQKHYNGTRNIILLDSSTGVTTDKFINEDLPNWDPFKYIPERCRLVASVSFLLFNFVLA